MLINVIWVFSPGLGNGYVIERVMRTAWVHKRDRCPTTHDEQAQRACYIAGCLIIPFLDSRAHKGFFLCLSSHTVGYKKLLDYYYLVYLNK